MQGQEPMCACSRSGVCVCVCAFKSLPTPPTHHTPKDNNVLPNPESRVCLAQLGNDPTSSFINANYVSGYNGLPKRFIATQGPIPATIADFW